MLRFYHYIGVSLLWCKFALCFVVRRSCGTFTEFNWTYSLCYLVESCIVVLRQIACQSASCLIHLWWLACQVDVVSLVADKLL
jgi:hypothetical protein